jgi:hypothetical protein
MYPQYNHLNVPTWVNEIHQIARSEPSIVERIDEDLDLHAEKKKLLRLADAEFLAGQTLDLPKLQLQLRELKIDDIELETGRPRTDAYIVYLFLMLRGFNGGCKDQNARLFAAGVYHAQTLARTSGAGTPWWVTGRNWHAVGRVLSRHLCCLVATQPTARTLLRWSRSRSPTRGHSFDGQRR